MPAVLDYLPRGNTLRDDAWRRRHALLQGILLAHIPALFLFGLWRGVGVRDTAEALALPVACLALGRLMRSRRPASLFITGGLVYCSAALVGLSGGSIEAHFHFFIMIGFIALYQDWVPFLLNIVFTVLSHGFGSSLVPNLMFSHPEGQSSPWTWSVIHGLAVLAACVGVVLFWRSTEEEQQRSLRLTEQLSEAELGRRRFTSDLLVNLARRNQNLLHRQLDLLNDLEEKEHDPDALAHLFQLDHLATRIRRNAESLLVLSGEETPRMWRGPVSLVDVVRAAIAETEDLDRVDFAVDESLSLSGRVVADVTHMLAELLENAVRFSPPGVTVMLRTRPFMQAAGAQVLTIEDWGVGMTPAEINEANDSLARPREVDLSVSQRLGLHVVARLAQRHGIAVHLTQTPGGGVTAVALLPPELFTADAPVAGAVRTGDPLAPTGELAGVGAGAVRAELSRGAVPDGRRPADPVPPVRVRPSHSLDADAPPSPQAPPASLPRPPSHAREAAPTAVLPAPPAPAARPPAPEPAARPPAPEPAGRPPAPEPAGRPPAPEPAARPPAPEPAVRTETEPAGPAPAGSPDRPPALPRRSPGLAAHPAPPFQLSGQSDGAGRSDDGWNSWWTPHQQANDRAAPSRPDSQVVRSESFPMPDAPAGASRAGEPPLSPQPAVDEAAGHAERPSVPGESARPAGRTDPPVPDSPAQPASSPPSNPSNPSGQPTLSRRVPRANLAAGLRRDGEEGPEPAPPVRDPLAARDALSRFQASQRQAREAVGQDLPDDAGFRPGWGDLDGGPTR